jgi:hypothetical protein
MMGRYWGYTDDIYIYIHIHSSSLSCSPHFGTELPTIDSSAAHHRFFSGSDPWNHPFRDIAASGRVARPPRPEKKQTRHAGSTHEMLINFLDSVVEQLIIRYKA